VGRRWLRERSVTLALASVSLSRAPLSPSAFLVAPYLLCRIGAADQCRERRIALMEIPLGLPHCTLGALRVRNLVVFLLMRLQNMPTSGFRRVSLRSSFGCDILRSYPVFGLRVGQSGDSDRQL